MNGNPDTVATHH